MHQWPLLIPVEIYAQKYMVQLTLSPHFTLCVLETVNVHCILSYIPLKIQKIQILLQLKKDNS